MAERIDKTAEKKLGKTIRFHRGINGYTINDIAQLLGVSTQQIQKYEVGINRISATKLHVLAKFLKIPLDLFFDEYKYATADESVFTEQAYAVLRNYIAINDQAIKDCLEIYIKNLANIDQSKAIKA
jgi:transcriptional regulator with XRE-family HTH domain